MLLFISGSHSPTENASVYFLTVFLLTTAPLFVWVPQSHIKCSYIFSNCDPSKNSFFFSLGPTVPQKMLRYIFKMCSFTQPLLYFSGSHSPTENAPLYFLTVLIHTIVHIFLWVPQSHRKCSNIFSNCVPSHNCSYFCLLYTSPSPRD